jgi:hypothetical protein
VDTARQKVKDTEVRKYLEDLESEALMKGKIFYRVQKILCKSAGKLSGVTTQARGTLPGILGKRVTLRNSKGQTVTGTRNETRCGQCELGNRACVAPDNAVSEFFVCIHQDLCSKADPGAMHPLRVGAQEVHQEKPLGSRAYHSAIEHSIAAIAAIVYKASIYKSPLYSAL